MNRKQLTQLGFSSQLIEKIEDMSTKFPEALRAFTNHECSETICDSTTVRVSFSDSSVLDLNAKSCR